MKKKHLNYGQGLEFLKFGQGKRGLDQQNKKKPKDTIRNNEGKRGKNDQTIRGRDPYFLFDFFLFNIFSVVVLISFTKSTPGSMNRLFSDFFRKFEGVVFEVFGTIWGCLGEILTGKLG